MRGMGRRLHDRALAGAAAIARTARHQNAEGGRHDVEPLRDILTDDMEIAAAAGAGLVLDIDDLLDPLKMRRQRAPVGLARSGAGGALRRRIQTGLHAR